MATKHDNTYGYAEVMNNQEWLKTPDTLFLFTFKSFCGFSIDFEKHVLCRQQSVFWNISPICCLFTILLWVLLQMLRLS